MIRLALMVLLSAGTAAAQPVYLSFICDLQGAPAEMVMEVHYQQAFDYSTNQGNISGVFPAGMTIYTAGTVISDSARYSFRGENQFADFITLGSNESFRVQWELDAQRNGLWMIVNPFGGTTSHFCQYQGAQ